MTKSVLGTIVLGYRPMWNRLRELAGVQLFIEVDPVHPVDARHLLRTLEEIRANILAVEKKSMGFLKESA